MLSRNTVLVLGAGSSVDFGIGAGDQLAKAIAQKTRFTFEYGRQTGGDRLLMEALSGRDPNKRQPFFMAGSLISQSLPAYRSIDEFLFTFGDDPDVIMTGKAAIAQSIVEAEAKSKLAKPSHSQEERVREFHALGSSWLYQLFGHLQTDVRRTHLERLFENLTIINFNYDRCVEEFLFRALRIIFLLNETDAAALMQSLRIEHPYGRVGRLPWEPRREGPAIEFGGAPSEEQLMALAGSIRTFTEQTHSAEELASWRIPLQQVEQVVFLGFAFHKQNMDLLTGSGPVADHPQAIATAYGTSPSDQQVFVNRIRDALSPTSFMDASNVRVSEDPCDRFMRNWGILIAS